MQSRFLPGVLVFAAAGCLAAHIGAEPPRKTEPAGLVSPFNAREAKVAQEAAAKSLGLPAAVTKNAVGMELVLIPPGRFRMGSGKDEKGRPQLAPGLPEENEAQVDVAITRPFYLGKTEVTQGQWRKVMGTTPWKGQDTLSDGDEYPVTAVSWLDAQAFCEKLSAQDKREYRLPTEAEWEYACRAGTTTRFHCGDDEALLLEHAWFGAPIGEGVDETDYEHTVGLKKPNAFGLYDMHGNAGEWCADWYGPKYAAGELLTDPAGPKTGDYRVYRGGDWFAEAKWCRSASRGWAEPSARQFVGGGFRVASSADR